MKQTFRTTFLILTLILLLAACSSAAPTAQEADSSTASSPTEAANPGTDASTSDTTDFVPGSLEPTTALMVGAVLLDETEYAIDAAQAAALLPLWKALRSLSASETAAQAEIDAVVAQIQETMTAEQLAALAAMQLSAEDMAVAAETLGIEIAFGGGRFGEMTPEMQATAQAARESGEFPAGQVPGGEIPGGTGPGGGMGQGGGEFANLTPEERQALMAERGGMRGAQVGINSGLLDGVITFLAAKLP